MKPKNERPFYKVIAVVLAVTMMSAGLTGCDWFKPRQEESQQTIELEAPEPDEENPGEDILDENEVSADRWPLAPDDSGHGKKCNLRSHPEIL